MDVTTHDLEFHSFMRLSHQYIVNEDCFDVKVEDSFELYNPNLFDMVWLIVCIVLMCLRLIPIEYLFLDM